jgi:DnaK suppressor protein
MTVETTLAAARSDLERHIERIEAEARANGTASISFGKRIGDGTSVAVERLNEIAILERLTKQHRSVVRAEAKVADGTYGACDACGETIDHKRLSALPWAIHCVTCADLEAVPPDDAPSTREAKSDGPRSATADASSPWDGLTWSS